MSNSADRLAAIQANYDMASSSEPADLAAAQTVAEVTAVQANVALARSTYYGAIADALSAETEAAEAAYEAAVSARTAVETARREAAALPDLLGKMVDATAAAHRLLLCARVDGQGA